MTDLGKVSLMAGILIAGLSPSFIDWEQSPELRKQMYVWYIVVFILVAFGLWDGG